MAAAAAAWFTGRLASIAKDTAERELRAYVIAESAHIASMKPNEPVVVGFAIKNIGQTPAYNVREELFVEIMRDAPVDDSSIEWTWIDHHGYMGERLFFPSIEANRYTESDIKKIKAGSRERLYIIGRVHYRDIYRIPRCMDFCFMYLGEAKGEFSFCPSFNDADYPGCAKPSPKD